ncbi:MAG: M15 family metallopeptidase [Bacilli bacterium]|nr:M15 family metallopeptidase [Bacilli bacterium]
MKKYILIIIFILFIIGCDNDFYKNIKDIKNPNDTLVLVNKNNKLKNDFIPDNLVKLDLNYSHAEKYLKEEAALEFYKLSEEAKKLNYRIVAVSGYRSYTYQEKLFEYYVETKGMNYTLMCSAKPGHSEHQTGLAIDVEGSNLDYNLFEKSKEFEWMKKNAHKYGFILRYPKGKENITGFKYEPWHYRYVGKEVATIIYNNKLTFEEYHKKFVK